ncbi:MAG: hypothetical protein M1817_005335 [Caeruleum heppii]|nr:MAG: hypothetical protein M1817_005335 [Caeruleum heppii]
MKLLLSLLLATQVLSSPAPAELEERQACNRDNVLRALLNPRNAVEATSFCRNYIPTTETITPTNAVTVTATTTSTVYSRYTPLISMAKAKRDVPPIPTFISQYPASRVSSACSCLSVTPLTRTTTLGTVTVTATRTIPALCNPTNFKQYQGAVDKRQPVQLQQVAGTTEQECCITCFNAKDCTIFQFRPDNPVAQGCEYYKGLSQTDDSNREDVCPLGVSQGSGLSSPQPGRLLYNYGPCLESAPLF